MAKYKGRPSYASLARRRNELSAHSDKPLLESINDQIDDLSPGQYIRIPFKETNQLSKQTIQANIYRSNMRNNTNFKFHTDLKSGDWWIWFDPTPKPHTLPFLQPPVKIKPSNHAGSIHVSLADVCAYWKTSPESFNRLPFDVQLKKRIQAGIAIRAQRKLNRTFSKQPIK